MDTEQMTMQEVLRNEALNITEGMSPEEVTCYADQVLHIARSRAQEEVVRADELMQRALKLRDYADSIGK